MKLVVVESPAKAKTIEKYLGGGHRVLASYGHVRDLPPKDGSVDPEQNFRMLWEIDAKAQKRLNDIARAAGCSRATLYRYFDNRDALHAAYVPEVYAKWPERPAVDVISALSDGSFRAAPQLVDALIKAYAEDGD